MPGRRNKARRDNRKERPHELLRNDMRENRNERADELVRNDERWRWRGGMRRRDRSPCEPQSTTVSLQYPQDLSKPRYNSFPYAPT